MYNELKCYGKSGKMLSLILIKLNEEKAIYEVYCLCCCYIYDLPISEKGIESILRYIKGKIVAKGALLNKVATEIALTCSDIDIFLPSMLKSAVK